VEAVRAERRTAPRVDQPSVLLVDDRPANLDALAAALDPLGADLVRATSAEEALRHVLARDFAVVLLDVEMPETDGFETARLIRARERSRATPIIFVTARDRDEDTTLAGHEAGAVDVLYKPLDAAVLAAKVSVFLELSRLRDESVLAAQLREMNALLRESVVEAEEARRRAEQADLAKGQFLATMSHEIRTPINAMLGYTQLIELGLAGPVTDEQRGFLTRLRNSGQHLMGLVNDILDLSKILAEEMSVAQEPGWTGPAVAGAIVLSEGLAAARGIRIVDAKPSATGVPYVGDEHRVRQILLNLLSNAIKFTEAGGVITVDCERVVDTPSGTNLQGEGPWACIRVHDTGIGMSAEAQRRLFEPFHQVDTGHTRSRGGTGLGLSISRRLARLMGGDLTAKSTLGRGSEFSLWLPAPAASEDPEARSVRAMPSMFAIRDGGLNQIGEALRDEAHDVVRAYTARLRVDPDTPKAVGLRQPDLEDHAITLLADLAQSLIIVDEAEAQAVELLADATEIQRMIGDRHGLRRYLQGWSEASVRRDFAVLGEELERAVRERIPARSVDVDRALSVVMELLARVEEISCQVWRERHRRDVAP
jgi:signal transduction histidine kinase